MTRHLRMVEGPLEPSASLDFAARNDHGAVNVFIGQIRDTHLGRRVTGIDFDAHPMLAEALMQTLADEAEALAGVPLSIWLEHSHGFVPTGARCIVIAVSAPHRDAAFAACRHLIEAAKHRLPVWKRECYADESSAWLGGTPLAAP